MKNSRSRRKTASLIFSALILTVISVTSVSQSKSNILRIGSTKPSLLLEMNNRSDSNLNMNGIK